MLNSPSWQIAFGLGGAILVFRIKESFDGWAWRRKSKMEMMAKYPHLFKPMQPAAGPNGRDEPQPELPSENQR